jgi:hypothetical protein
MDNIKSPRQLAEELMNKSVLFSKYSGEYASHIKIQADYFNKERENHKSDNATQKAFDATKEGVQMVIIKLKLRALEKEMSAIKTMLRLMEGEANSIY